MAAISTYLARIKSAILGEEVRGAIYDSIKAINDENVNVLNNCKAASNEAVKAYNDAKNVQKVLIKLRTMLAKQKIMPIHIWQMRYN